MKKICLLFSAILSLFVIELHAQITILGQLKDSTENAIVGATVMLLSPIDSVLVNYTISNSDGKFIFKNIRKSNYILNISHVTYMPYQTSITPKEEEKELNLGQLKLKPIANFLMEIVIREAKAPIFIKGDTVEYDASTFKVAPGSTVEDLLRRLPGIDVDANGEITTMGKDIKTVYVDGKAFFGTDPKTVTQNLDAAAVKKVQVFNEQTEQEKITGIKDGSDEKVMNLELKEEYKKGYFGKATVGYGWGQGALHRWMARGSFNYFTEKQQLSFLGYGNNINASNFNWSDYSEFKGQSMQTGNDNGTFGFNSGQMFGSRYFSYSNYGGDGSGFSQNVAAGVNYNYYDKKIKFNAGYFYTRNYTYSDYFANRETFLVNSSYWRIDTSKNENVRNNHDFGTRFEYQIDSNNNIVLRANLDYSYTSTENKSMQLFKTFDLININRNNIHNITKNNNFNMNTLAIYTHKFKKKGRVFAISGNYIFTDGKSIDDISNMNEFLMLSPNEQIKFITKNNEKANTHTTQSSLLYVEPLGKKFTLQGFYNFSNSWRSNTNKSEDENANPIDSLQMTYTNSSLYNRVGTSLNFAYKGVNLLVGAAYQNLQLKGKSLIWAKQEHLSFSYHNFIPYFKANFELPHNIHFNVDYSYSVEEPSMSHLFPMPDLSNILYKTLGNPDLKPERFHEISTWISYWSQASMSSVSLSGDAIFYDSQIVYNQTTQQNDSVGLVTVSKPKNVKGGDAYHLYLWSNFPIVKTILTMNISIRGQISRSPVFIDTVKNITNTKATGGSIGFNITAGQKLTLYINGSVSTAFTNYSIQTERNQNYQNYSANTGFKWQIFKKTFLEGSYSFSNYSNKKLDFYQNIHTLNISIRQVLGKKNQFELRLAGVDLLNQNLYIRQYENSNYIEYRTSPTLARYVMLTFAYNLKGFEISNKSRNYF